MVTQSVYVINIVMGYLLMLISVIPLIRFDNWIFRIFEYPRAQKLFLNVLLIVAFIFISSLSTTHDTIFISLLVVNFCYLFYQVFPYTFFSKNQMKNSALKNSKQQFRLMIFNVFQDNRNATACIECIKSHKPDILLLVETDKWWQKQIRSIAEYYSYRVEYPLDNTYGMLLYSKFELIDPEVKFLVEKTVPSIHTLVKLPSGAVFKLYGLHPQPPVPGENSRSTERDAEILMVAKEAKSLKLPVIVAGDLNDVAWSYTTELFLKVSELLDPRRGRGFFNTYNAKHWYLRWPLDHIFCSKHFHLIKLTRLPDIGSDHFPIVVELLMGEQQTADNERDILKADADDRKTADEKISNVR